MAKRLLVTSTELMMIQFLVPHICHLKEEGYIIDLACSNVGGRMDEVYSRLQDTVNQIHEVRLVRSPLSLENRKGYGDLKKIIDQGNYDLIWTNEPVMGVMTRLAARTTRRQGTKVLYMIHGFHFFRGAPLLYWMAFYPIERFMANECDMICTINTDDYRQALKFACPNVRYIHGIGVNTERMNIGTDTDIRTELSLSEKDFLVLTVAELNANKNQKVVIESLSILNDPSVHYLLCGIGDRLEKLQEQTEELGLSGQVHFLGYRKDVLNIARQSDLFILPSHREGLPLAMMEAMYNGLPVLGGNIRGVNDLIDSNQGGYFINNDDPEDVAEKIALIKNNETKRKQFGEYNQKKVIPFLLENTKEEVAQVLCDLSGC